MAKTKRQKAEARNRRAAMEDLRRDEQQHVEARRHKRAEDPRAVVMAARVRQMAGQTVGDFLLPMYEHPCGQAIAAKAKDKDEALALWAIFDPMDKADAAWCRHVIGRPRFATTTKLELMPEAFEARPDDKPDLRTDAEKHRDASEAQARWRGYMAALTQGERGVIRRVLRGLSEPMRDGKVTCEGHRFVRAMRSLRNEMTRQG